MHSTRSVSPIEAERHTGFPVGGTASLAPKTADTTTPRPSSEAAPPDSTAAAPIAAEKSHPAPQAIPRDTKGDDEKILAGAPVAAASYHKDPSGWDSHPNYHYAEFQQDNLGPQVALNNHSYPQTAYDKGNYPEVVGQDYPQAYAADGAGLEHVGHPEKGAQQQKTVCGLRRRWFWLIVLLVLIAVIIAAVVGGVVGSRNSSKSSKDSFMPTTQLAAINYTEVNGVTHYRVYWQAKSNDLYVSEWNSNSQSWSVSPLNPNKKSGIDVKANTPLAAYTYQDNSQGTIEYHIFFSDTSNKLWERGTFNSTDMWADQVQYTIQGNYTMSNNSKISTYAQGCDNFCAPTSVVVWQNTVNDLYFAGYLSNYGWWSYRASSNDKYPLIDGSALSIRPIWANASGLLALYANNGNMSRYIFNTTSKWETGWSYNASYGEIDSDANIASFMNYFVGANDSMADVQVVSTRPGATGGGLLTWDSDYARNNLTNSTTALATDFSAVSNSSAVAMTQGGRLYAIEGEQLIEWEWQHDNRTYTRIGVVNTEIP